MVSLNKPKKSPSFRKSHIGQRTKWPELLNEFLSSGENLMEIAGWEDNYADLNSVYHVAYHAVRMHGYEKLIALRQRNRALYLVRKDVRSLETD